MKLFKSTLFVAIIALMASCGDKTATGDLKIAKDSTANANLVPDSYNGKIVYLRMDSLMRGYGMYIDMSDEFGKKQTKVQSELTAKGRSLEREVAEYQEKAQKGLITRYQAQTTEEGLQKKQGDIVAYRDRVMNELAQEESVMSATILKQVMDYLREYNVEKKYSMIIQTMGGNPVILADPSLDITSDVLTELNRRYEATISTKK